MNTPETGTPWTYLGLGSNVGRRSFHLGRALRALLHWDELRNLQCSRVYETAYVGPGEQDDYWNLCARAEIDLPVLEILARTRNLEESEGRPPGGHMEPRRLDVDILLHRGQRHEGPVLTLPHPRMHERRFVLEPLAELDPELAVGPGERPVVERLEDEEIRRQRVRALGPVEEILASDGELIR